MKTPMQEMIKKWKASPSAYGRFDIIGVLQWYAEEYNDTKAERLLKEIVDDEEYEVKYLIQRVEQTFNTKER
jgi:phage terminase Nu1 subunit (DNA packaging protein)